MEDDDDFFGDGNDGVGSTGLMPIVEVPSESSSQVNSARSSAAPDEEENPYSDQSFEDESLDDDDEEDEKISIPTADVTSERKEKKKKHKTHKKHGRSHVDMTEPTVLLKKAEKKAKHYTKHKKADKAITEYVKCLALTRIVHGDGHWKLAQAHVNLAQGYFDLKNYAVQTQHHAENARNIMMGGLQMSSSSTDKANIMEVLMHIYYTLGRAFTVLKKFSEADQSFTKAEKLSTERGKLSNVTDASVEDWDIKISLAIARLSAKQEKHAIAMEYFEKALDLLEKKFGSDSKELIPVYQSMGRLEQSKGRHADHHRAIEDFLQAHSIASAHNRGGSIEVADTARSLATAYANVGTEEAETSAESYLNECLAIYQGQYGPHHEKTLDVQDEIARLMIRTDRHEEALIKLRSTFEAKKEVYGDYSGRVADAWKLIGSVYLSQEDSEKAAKALKKCYETERLVYGESSKRTKNTKSMLDILLANPSVAAKIKGSNSSQDLKDRPAFNSIVSRSTKIGGFKTQGF